MPGLAVWSCLVYPHMNKSLPSLTSALAVVVDRASVWSCRGSQGPRLFQQDILQFYMLRQRRSERDGLLHLRVITTRQQRAVDTTPWSCNHHLRLPCKTNFQQLKHQGHDSPAAFQATKRKPSAHLCEE